MTSTEHVSALPIRTSANASVSPPGPAGPGLPDRGWSAAAGGSGWWSFGLDCEVVPSRTPLAVEGPVLVCVGSVESALRAVRRSGAGMLIDARDAERVDALLTVMVVSARDGLPMTVWTFARVLGGDAREGMPALRATAGMDGGVSVDAVRLRVDRLLRKVLRRLDDTPGLLDEVTDALLAESSGVGMPGGAHCGPSGGVALVRGFAAPAGSVAAASSSGGGDAGWWTRAGEAGALRCRWGYEVTFTVAVPGPAGGSPRGTVVGIRLHRPGRDPVGQWMALLAAARSRPGVLPEGSRRSPSVWVPWPPDRGWGRRLAAESLKAGFQVRFDEGEDGELRTRAGRTAVGAEAALDKAGASRRGAGSVLASRVGTALVVACELSAWNLTRAGRDLA